MRLYVWTEFCPDFRDGLAFAIARDIEEAKRLVVAAHGYNPVEWGPVAEFPTTDPIAFTVRGGN